MSRELFKMNMIASVQKLDNEDIEIIENYIKTIEQENTQLKNYIRNSKDVDYLDSLINNLNYRYDENKQLKEKIDKAIEYIHWRYDNRQDMYITQMKELLEILGDKE